jgi:hypothetical protein
VTGRRSVQRRFQAAGRGGSKEACDLAVPRLKRVGVRRFLAPVVGLVGGWAASRLAAVAGRMGGSWGRNRNAGAAAAARSSRTRVRCGSWCCRSRGDSGRPGEWAGADEHASATAFASFAAVGTTASSSDDHAASSAADGAPAAAAGTAAPSSSSSCTAASSSSCIAASSSSAAAAAGTACTAASAAAAQPSTTATAVAVACA